MLYTLVRAIAGVALRWFYRDIQVEGRERIPRDRPVLLVVNHPNALVDALLVVGVVPRRVVLTAKGTLFANPIASAMLRLLGVVPLHRTSDADRAGERPDPARNRGSFRAVVAARRRGATVLIFPEGKSHDEPSLAPMKSGAARMALEAIADGHAADLAIVPIGLSFERKDEPRTRVLVQVGEPITLERWTRPEHGAADALTSEIDARLRAVTLNYATIDDANRTLRIASLVAVLVEDLPKIGVVDRRFGEETTIARRLDEVTARLETASPELRGEAEELVGRLDAVQRTAEQHGVLLEDVAIPIGLFPALRFVLREGWLVLVGGPFAIWGRINHWVPFRAARMIATRSNESAADPAMRTLVAGAALLIMAYLLQTTLVSVVWGPIAALVYLVSLPITADINFYLSDRVQRGVRRARAFLLFRRDPQLQQRLAGELAALRDDVRVFDRMLGGASSVTSA